MDFSIDTNITIGILNPKDKLHNMSINLLRNKTPNSKLILFYCILTETKRTFIKKYNKAAGKILDLVNSLSNNKLEGIEFNREYLKSIDNLIKENKDIDGFINLIYNQISPFIVKKQYIDCFKFISNKGLAHLEWTEDILAKEAQGCYSKYNLKDINFYRKIKDTILNVSFGGLIDRELFLYSISYHYTEKKEIEVYSNDNDFIVKSSEGLNLITKDLGHEAEVYFKKL